MLREVAKSTAAILMIQAINFLVPLAALPRLTRALGPTDFGIYSVLLVYGNYVLLVSDYSFNTNGPLRVAEAMKTRGLRDFVANATFLKALLLLPSFAVFVWAAWNLTDHRFALIVAGFANAAALSLTPRWVMYSLNKLYPFAIFSLLTKGVWLALIYALVWAPKDLELLLWMTAGTQAALLVASMVSIARVDSLPGRFSLRRTWAVFRRDLRQFVSLLALFSLRDMAVVVLSAVVLPAQISLYSVADRIRFAIMSVVAPVSQSLFLLTARTHSGVGTELQQRVRGLTNGGIFLIALVAGICIAVAAPLIISLFGGGGYSGAVPLLRILAFVPACSALTSIFGVNTLLGFGFQREFSNVQLVAVAIGAPLLLGLTVSLGVRGAAFGALGVELLTALLLGGACLRHGVLGKAFGLRD